MSISNAELPTTIEMKSFSKPSSPGRHGAPGHVSKSRRRFKLSFRIGVILCSVMTVLVATSLIGVPALILVNGITSSLTDAYGHSLDSTIEGILLNLQHKLEVIGGFMLEFNDSSLYSPSLPWCHDASIVSPPSISLGWQFLRQPDVNMLSVRRFWNGTNHTETDGGNMDFSSSMTILTRGLEIGVPTLVCLDSSDGITANVWLMPDAFHRFYLQTISAPKLGSFSKSGLQIGNVSVLQIRPYPLCLPLVYALVREADKSHYFSIIAGVNLDDVGSMLHSINSQSQSVRVALVETLSGEMVATNIAELPVVNLETREQIKLSCANDTIFAKVGDSIWNTNLGPGDIIDSRLQVNGRWWLIHGFSWKFNNISAPLTAIVIQDEKEAFGPSHTLFTLIIVLIPCLALIWAIVSVPLAWRISTPLWAVSSWLDGLSNLDMSKDADAVDLSTFAEVSAIQKSCFRLQTAMRAFVRYVPISVCKNLISGQLPACLGVKHGEVAVMFLDVVNFTTLTELERPETLIQAMAVRFDALVKVITDHGGTIDKFIGDSIMAFFNEPTRIANFNEVALQAACHCMEVVRLINEKCKDQLQVHFKTGISTGPCLVGNVGGGERFSFTVLGKYVNEAARLESATRQFGVDILISSSMYSSVRSSFLCRKLRTCQLKGFTVPHAVYQPMCHMSQCTQEIVECVDSYNVALSMLEQNSFQEAADILSQNATNFPDDTPTKVLLEEVQDLLANGVPPNWSPTKNLEK
ncbi:adenylate cyclase, adenylate cyclase [Pelomyxa schiedti]|nr:adenylate cyclase, adenylate cyclase [Pelomyxa schiedti]